MDEEKEKQKPKEKPEEKKSETPVENKDAGSKYETTPIIERAREEREKLDAANKKKEELLDREEKIMARRELGGQTEAGTTETPEFSEKEKASRARIKAVADASGSSWGKNYE